jgi:energy-coupling factor transporter ATP-binding protein EcfA2
MPDKMSSVPQFKMPVFFVVGPVGHGKTTAREILSRLLHARGGSCSDVIYHFLSIRKGVSIDDLRQLPKEQFRPQLIEAGDYLCGQIGQLAEVPENEAVDAEVYRHPSALIRTLYMNGFNVIDGVRRRLELEHAKDHLDWAGVEQFTIHISDPRKPTIADNSEDLRDLADEQIVNDGTPEELEQKLSAALSKRFPVEPTKPHPLEETAEVSVVAVKDDAPDVTRLCT